MKQFSIILIIVLFNSILNKTYDLETDIEKKVNSLKAKEIYYFNCYTLPFHYKIANISLAINSTSMPFSSVYIYEYSSETSKDSLAHYQSITFSYKNNEYISSFLCSITNFDTKFISLKIVPSYNIDYIKILVTLKRNKFELSNGVKEKITNLKSGLLYYFFISCHLFQSASISLSTSSSSYYPFNYLYANEYTYRYSSECIKTTSLYFTSYTNGYLNYQVSDNNTQDIALQIKPNYDLDYITVKIYVDDITFNLSNGLATNVTNLRSGNRYYFFTPSIVFQNVSIILTKNSSNISIDDYMYVYEYRNRSTFDYIQRADYKVSSSSVISLSYLVIIIHLIYLMVLQKISQI